MAETDVASASDMTSKINAVERNQKQLLQRVVALQQRLATADHTAALLMAKRKQEEQLQHTARTLLEDGMAVSFCRGGQCQMYGKQERLCL